jgi:anti-sigma factor RsiW
MHWLRRKLDQTENECCGERLSAYIDRELGPEERVALERHLAECEDCRWNLETLRQTVEWTRDCAPVRVPRVFTIPVETAAPQPVRARRPVWGLPLLQGATALVALLFVFVVAGDLFLGSSAPRSAPQMVAVQMTSAMDQAAIVQEVEVTQLVELAAPAPTAAAAAAALPPSESAAAKAAATAPIAPPPSAPEALTLAVPAPTVTAEVGGIGGGPPAISVTIEVMVSAVESPLASSRAAVTPTATVTLAFTAVVPLPTQGLTEQVTSTESTTPEQTCVLVVTPTETAGPSTYLVATPVLTRQLLSMPTAAPTVEAPASAPMPVGTAVILAEQDAAQDATNTAAPSEAPAALLSGPEPTAIAAAPEVREAEQGARSGEEQGIVGTLRETVAPWFGLAEIALGAAFVLLALATAVVMLRWQRR